MLRKIPAVGQRAFTFSNANGMMQMGSRASFSMGIVSGVYEVEDLGGESGYHGPAIETTAAVNPGSDGGPIVNQYGQLCGILSLNSSPRRWQGIGVPIMQLLQQFRVFKEGKLKVEFRAVGRGAGRWRGGVAGRLCPRRQQLPGGRHRPTEVLRRNVAADPWDNYRLRIKDWDKLSAAERLRGRSPTPMRNGCWKRTRSCEGRRPC